MPRSPSSPGWSIVDPASRDSSTLHKGAGSGPLPGDAEAPTPRATVTGVDLDLSAGRAFPASSGSGSVFTAVSPSEAGSAVLPKPVKPKRVSEAGASLSSLKMDDIGPRPLKEKRKHIQRVKHIDLFAIKEKPSTILGGIVTVGVIAGLVAYTIYVVLAYMNRPWSKTPVNQWTYNSGPWPLKMRCRAASGCYVSNHASQQWSGLTLDPAQSQCQYLAPGDWTTVNIAFSNNPNEGLGVIFVPGPSDTTGLPGNLSSAGLLPTNFGFEIESQVVCAANVTTCKDDTYQLLTPMAGGLNLVFLVETTNNSATGLGYFRREWYPTQVANLNNALDVSVVSAATTCNTSLFNSSWAHSRVRINAEYVQLSVDREALWLVIWGSVGGALGMFMQIGAIMVSLTSIIMQIMDRRRQVADGSMSRSVSMADNSLFQADKSRGADNA